MWLKLFMNFNCPRAFFLAVVTMPSICRVRAARTKLDRIEHGLCGKWHFVIFVADDLSSGFVEKACERRLPGVAIKSV